MIAVFHVFISHFAVGGGLFLVLSERKARRSSDDALLAYLKRHSRFFMLVTLVLGAVTGVGIWFAIALVHPSATSSLINTFVWGWAIEWTFFITEIAAAMVYYYGWDRLSAKTHEIVGWIYFIAAWMSLVIINGIITFQLTPGRWIETRNFWDGFWNETYWPSLVARTFVCFGLAGIYALLTVSVGKDAGMKEKMARWAGGYWVLPMAVALPLSLIWYISAVLNAGIPAGRIMGSDSETVGAILKAIISGGGTNGYPLAQRGASVAILASVLVALVTLFILLVRKRSYGLVLTVPLMILGQIAFAGGEWMREDLRKPYVIGRYMFVNSVRLPSADTEVEDRFTITALNEKGVLKSSLWLKEPDGFDSRTGPDPALDPEERAAVEEKAGERLFHLLCFSCHTTDGYLALEPLVRGKSVGAMEQVLGSLAKPVDADGNPTTWSDPDFRLETRLGRRMPPFVGTEAERRALAVWMARLGGDTAAGVPAVAPGGQGKTIFDEHCSFCHGDQEDWPMAERIGGRTAEELYELLWSLQEINEYMEPFPGTEEEGRALAEYLAGMED